MLLKIESTVKNSGRTFKMVQGKNHKEGEEYGEVEGSMTPWSNSLLIWFRMTSILGGDNLYGGSRITF